MTAKEMIFEYLDNSNPGTRFTGYDLVRRGMHCLDEMHYPDTYLRYIREYRQKTGREIVNINKKKSIYEVIS